MVKRQSSGRPSRPGLDSVSRCRRLQAQVIGKWKITPAQGDTGENITPDRLVGCVKLAHGWHFDALTLGLPVPPPPWSSN